MARIISLTSKINWVRMKLNQVPSPDADSAFGRFYLLLTGQMGVRLPNGTDWLAARDTHTHAPELPSLTGNANKYLQVKADETGTEWDTVAAMTDHGSLTGLLDDDHPQYHNDARGDARYYTQAQITTLLAAYYTAAQLNAGQLDNRYYTESEVDTMFTAYYTAVQLNAGQLDNRYYTESEINALLSPLQSASHTHINFALLETYTQTNADLADAVTKKHTHTNLALLETYTQTNADLANAVTKAHDAVTVVSGTGVTVGLSGQQVTVTLNNTAVSAGTYNLATVTVNAQGQLTAASTAYAERAIVSVSASKSLALSDRGTKQMCSSASAIALTVPTNASVAFPVGTEIDIFRNGAGAVSFTASGGVTIRTAGTLAITAQWRAAHLTKIATDEWVLIGAV